MKTLVIHIQDTSTDFLKPIYDLTAQVTVVRTNLSAKVMNDLIEEHDRVIMLGHGSDNGLFGDGGGMIIGAENVPALEKKDNSIFIWCHASDFVTRWGLKGFSTGMFISEVSEALFCDVGKQLSRATLLEDVEASNDEFAWIVGQNIDLNDPAELLTAVKSEYDLQTEVCNYNRRLLVAK